MKNPLRKRYLRELKSSFGKYLVIFLMLLLTISLVSGFLVADRSMIIAYDESFETYNIENGHFITENRLNKSVRDASALTDIRNTDGDEEYLPGNDGMLYWENNGEAISYKGDSTANLPAGVKVTYYLNDKETPPVQMAHASGSVRIRFDYTVSAAADVTVDGVSMKAPIPFIAVSMVLMPSDVFSEIEVTNGGTMLLDGETVACGLALPKTAEYLDLSSADVTDSIDLPDYVEISAQTEDFHLDFTETIFTTGLFGKLKEEELEDTDDLFEAMDKLSDAGDDLTEGCDALLDASDELADGTASLLDASDELADGAASLLDAAKELEDGGAQLQIGAAAISDGAASLSEGADTFGNSLSEYVSGVSNAVSGADSLSEGLSQLAADTGLQEGAQNLTDGLSGLSELIAGYQAADTDNKNAEMLAALSAYTAQLQSGSAALNEGIGIYQGHVENAAAGSGALADGLHRLSDADDTLLSGYQTLQNGIRSLQNGIQQFRNEGLSALTGGLTAFRKDGVQKLCDGTAEFRDEGVQKLCDGIAEFHDEGIKELANGIAEFNEEGIQKLTDTFGEDFKGVLKRLKALSKADAAGVNFAGLADGTEGEVLYLIETAGI